MMEADESTMSAKPSRRRRWALRFVKFIRYMIVFSIALVLLYIILDQIVWRRVVAQRAAFAERFGVASENSANPEQPSAEEDAGRYYRYAWSLIAKATDVSTEWDPYRAMHHREVLTDTLGNGQLPTPEAAEEYARSKLAAAQPGLDIALSAARMDRGILAPTYDSDVILQCMYEARGLAQYMSARAEIAARDGDPDLAFDYVFSTLRLASATGENRTLLAQLVQISIVGMAFETSQRVLTTCDPASDSVSEIATELRELRDPERFVRILTGESLYMRNELYETMDAMPRLWAGINELKMSETLTAMADAANTDDPNRRRDLLAQAEASAKQGPYLLYALAQVTAPAVLRSMDAWERMIAQTTLMEVGWAISQYHAEHGAYPETLDEAAAYLGGEVPSDPYTGTPLMYEKRGAGYVLYSVGPNLHDDGGEPLHGPGGIIGDVLWAIGQPEPQPIVEAEDTASAQGRQGLFQRRGH